MSIKIFSAVSKQLNFTPCVKCKSNQLWLATGITGGKSVVQTVRDLADLSGAQ